jgi:flagellar motor switch/type III secretory pathway protein FliN
MGTPENKPAEAQAAQAADPLQVRPRFSPGQEIELDAIEDVPVEVTVVLGETIYYR